MCLPLRVAVIEDAGWSAKDLRRPGIKAALETLEAGDAKALVVAKLDRLSRSLLDFAGLMAKAQRQGWGVITLDVQVDTSTASGEAMANMLATFAQFERRLIGQRTREALAVKKAAGVRLGRPPTVPASGVHRIQHQRARGDSLLVIAESLNLDRVPTAQGGARWYAATVRQVLLRTS
jgi:DNA invertase Pin-like site-specific DNA recombinase